ncbi:desampylase [Haloplanus aerogenes]|uniref:M67 family peptidase n=1 Tax=Haloplanus aerogenes TaxID=660522 RepID=A0A3M0DQR2_9EURY|nr:desampylase [Haloplanus aerogenes]AZH24488.1 M67 family peptidase [Haloplanus aerogenes]RMB23864.1 proteasome lid subunit RPN8/RPN11 [Haloplanus aerogenes]
MTSDDTLRLAAGVRDALLDHAREGADREPPEEICGVLAGERGPPDRVTGARRVPNVAGHPRTEYELDPAATMDAIDRIEDARGDAVGFYHSHPESEPVPSATDRARATWEGYVYLIVSPPDSLRAYRYTGAGFTEMPIQVESSE